MWILRGPRLQPAWPVSGIARRSVWLEQVEQGREMEVVGTGEAEPSGLVRASWP